MTNLELIDVARAQLAMAKNLMAMAGLAIATAERILTSDIEAAEAASAPVPFDPPETKEEAPVPKGAVDPSQCEHPRQYRLDARAMGSPNRRLCTLCGGTFDA